MILPHEPRADSKQIRLADARAIPLIDSGDSVVGVGLVLAPMDIIGMNGDRSQNRSAASNHGESSHHNVENIDGLKLVDPNS